MSVKEVLDTDIRNVKMVELEVWTRFVEQYELERGDLLVYDGSLFTIKAMKPSLTLLPSPNSPPILDSWRLELERAL